MPADDSDAIWDSGLSNGDSGIFELSVVGVSGGGVDMLFSSADGGASICGDGDRLFSFTSKSVGFG